MFPHVGRQTQVNLPGSQHPVYPIVTQTLGVDFPHSVMGEFDDRATKSELHSSREQCRTQLTSIPACPKIFLARPIWHIWRPGPSRESRQAADQYRSCTDVPHACFSSTASGLQSSDATSCRGRISNYSLARRDRATSYGSD
jgi:hypothetical protein